MAVGIWAQGLWRPEVMGPGPHKAHLLLRSNASFYYSALVKVFLFGNLIKNTFRSAE